LSLTFFYTIDLYISYFQPQRQLKQESDPFKSDVSRNSFDKFAAKYFQHGYDAKYTPNEIIRPLLDLKSGVDQKVKSFSFSNHLIN
jgi:hypothetical protein